jgi:4-hydroxybenzoate polyprenyltransferase
VSTTQVIAGRSARTFTAKPWLQAVRLHNWSKNLAIFAPVIFAHAYSDWTTIWFASIAFLAMCFAASGSYLINDVADVRFDQRHRSKPHRPFANGRLSTRSGLIAAALFVLCGCGIALLLPIASGLTMLAYLALAVTYSLWLRRIPLLDVLVIATLFMLRVVMGTAAIGADYSPWLLSFSLVFFLSLACAKRNCELVQTDANGESAVFGRGYHSDDAPLTMAFGVGAGVTSIIIVMAYLLLNIAPAGFYPHVGWLYFIPASILIWLMRIWLLSHRKELYQDPVLFTLSDPPSLILGCAAVAAFVLSL